MITDEKGTKYYFGGDYNNLEISYSQGDSNVIPPPQSSPKGDYVINTWYLTKIEMMNGHTIEYKYKNDENIFKTGFFCMRNLPPLETEVNGSFFDLYKNVNQEYVMTRYYYDTSISGWHIWGNGSELNYKAPYFNYILVKKSFPESIKVNNKEVAKFSYELFPTELGKGNYPSLKLKEIEIKYNEIVNKINFSYYRNKDYIFLNELEFLGGRKYQFDYYQKESLPKETTLGVDFWGFWNGKSDLSNDLIPKYEFNVDTGDYNILGTSRNPNPNLAEVSLLKKVTYPTGGSSEFFYEGHTYSKKLERDFSSSFFQYLKTADGIVGGARIKKIIDSDGENKITKEYKYIANYGQSSTSSSGIFTDILRYMNYIDYKNEGKGRTITLVETANNFAVKPLNSSIIAYSEVSELVNDKLYKKYYFSDYVSNPDVLIERIRADYTFTTDQKPNLLHINFYTRYNSNENQRKKILKTTIYKDGNTDRVLKEIVNEYTSLSSHPLFQNNYLAFVNQRLAWVHYQKDFLYPYILESSTEKDYFDNQVVSKNINYSYDNPNHLQLTKTETTNSQNQTLTTKYYYPQDLVAEPFMDKLVAENQIASPIKTEQFKEGAKLSETHTKFGEFPTADPNKKLYLPTEVFASKATDINLNLGTDRKITYNSYDAFGNVTQYTPEGGTPVAIIWGYANTQPIAKLEGVSYSAIPATTITDLQNKANADINAATEKILYDALNTLRTSFPDAMVTTYTYDPLVGVNSITAPNGNTEYYNYDDAQRLKNIQDKDKNILKEWQYNYAKFYYNQTVSQTFTRTDCGNCAVAEPYTYTVPANKYSSTISQVDANSKAQAEIDANGQSTANTNGVCKPILRPTLSGSTATACYQNDQLIFSVAIHQKVSRDVALSGMMKIGILDKKYIVPNSPKYINYVNAIYQWRIAIGSSDGNDIVTAQLISPTNISEDFNYLSFNDVVCNYTEYENREQTLKENVQCNPGYASSGYYIYTVPAGKFGSNISQADADQQARNNIKKYDVKGYGDTTCQPVLSCGFTQTIDASIGSVSISGVGNSINYNVSLNEKGFRTELVDEGINIGTINATCKPSRQIVQEVSKGNERWVITISSTGNVNIRFLMGGSGTSPSYFSYSGSYQK
jgi:hypothetical protein